MKNEQIMMLNKKNLIILISLDFTYLQMDALQKLYKLEWNILGVNLVNANCWELMWETSFVIITVQLL